MVQAIEVQPGLWGVTTGTFDRVRVVRCLEGGDFDVTFANGSTQNIILEATTDVALAGLEITINSGTFALNK